LNCKLIGTYDRSGKLSNEPKHKLSIAIAGRKHSDESKKKMSEAKLGIKHTDEHRKNDSLAKLGIKHTDKSKQEMKKNNAKSIKVICVAGSRVFNSIADAAKLLGTSRTQLAAKLRGDLKNNTSMRYV